MAVVAAAGGSQRSSTIRLKIAGILVRTSPGGAHAHSIRPSLGFQTISVLHLHRMYRTVADLMITINMRMSYTVYNGPIAPELVCV